MEIKIKKLGIITVIFIISSDYKVIIKYFIGEEEVTIWNSLSHTQKTLIDNLCDLFFTENPELIKWSY